MLWSSSTHRDCIACLPACLRCFSASHSASRRERERDVVGYTPMHMQVPCQAKGRRHSIVRPGSNDQHPHTLLLLAADDPVSRLQLVGSLLEAARYIQPPPITRRLTHDRRAGPAKGWCGRKGQGRTDGGMASSSQPTEASRSQHGVCWCVGSPCFESGGGFARSTPGPFQVCVVTLPSSALPEKHSRPTPPCNKTAQPATTMAATSSPSASDAPPRLPPTNMDMGTRADPCPCSWRKGARR